MGKSSAQYDNDRRAKSIESLRDALVGVENVMMLWGQMRDRAQMSATLARKAEITAETVPALPDTATLHEPVGRAFLLTDSVTLLAKMSQLAATEKARVPKLAEYADQLKQKVAHEQGNVEEIRRRLEELNE